jgi:hypothetical protein
MVDRIVLFPSKRPGKRSGKDIAERVQIVLRGNELLAVQPGVERIAALTALD